MKACPTCGEGLADEAKFCPVDGTSLQGVVPKPGSPPSSSGSAFARTLYGVPSAAPSEPVPQAPAPSKPFQPSEAPADLNIRPAAFDDMDVSITPSEARAPLPAAPPVVRTGPRHSGPAAKARPMPKSLSLMMERPKSPLVMAIAAALGGAALIGLIATGVKVIRRPKKPGRPPAAAPVATAPSPPTPPPPSPPPAPVPVAPPAAQAPPTEPTVAAPPAGTAPAPVPRVAPTTGEAQSSGTQEQPPEPSPSPTTPGSDPRQADVYVRAGREHLSRGAYAKAQMAFEQARTYDPVNAAALAGLGEVAFEQGDYAAAVEKLRAAVRVDRNSRYLTMLGNSYFKMGQHKQALEQYKRALQLQPSNTEAAEGQKAAQKKLRGGP